MDVIARNDFGTAPSGGSDGGTDAGARRSSVFWWHHTDARAYRSPNGPRHRSAHSNQGRSTQGDVLSARPHAVAIAAARYGPHDAVAYERRAGGNLDAAAEWR